MFFHSVQTSKFLSTPSARRATPVSQRLHHHLPISIHALREEGDFLIRIITSIRLYFYPRPPRGGRRAVHRSDHGQQPISIHALREEGDVPTSRPKRTARVFLSTPSARRATLNMEQESNELFISIHALREEGDAIISRKQFVLIHISIHALREEGDVQADSLRHPGAISIHALREEGDRYPSHLASFSVAFLSTPSARRATRWPRLPTTASGYFYPRPPRGGRQQKQRQNLYFQTNYTTFCTNLEEP